MTGDAAAPVPHAPAAASGYPALALRWCSTTVSEDGKEHALVAVAPADQIRWRAVRTMHLDDHRFAILIANMVSPDDQFIAGICSHDSSFPATRSSPCGLPAGQTGRRILTGAGSSPRRRGGLGRPGVRRPATAGAGSGQRTLLIEYGGAGGCHGGFAGTVMVAAQQQVNRVRAGGGRRHHHREPPAWRTAARAVSKRQRRSLPPGHPLVSRQPRYCGGRTSPS